MKVAFRCDASEVIGTGHLARCIVFAENLISHGHDVIFIVRHITASMKSVLHLRNIPLEILSGGESRRSFSSDYSSWLGVEEIFDAEQSIKKLEIFSPDWVVVDHYGINADWEGEVARIGYKILAVDDLSDRKHFCNILIDPNSKREVKGIENVLSGPEYSFVASDFLIEREKASVRKEVKRVLVFFGGIDLKNATMMALKALLSMRANIETDIIVVAGRQNPNLYELEEFCISENISIHIQTDKMAQLMSQSDLFVGAAGSSNWERCVVGLPALLCYVAENQKSIASVSQRNGSAINLGDFDSLTSEDFLSGLNKIIGTKDCISKMSERAFQACDGMGRDRICSVMEQL